MKTKHKSKPMNLSDGVFMEIGRGNKSVKSVENSLAVKAAK
jgi:hypothetical protein